MNSRNFTVTYMIGKSYGKILVEAHDKEQAKIIAGIQVRCSLKRKGVFKALLVLEEGEEDTTMKDLDRYRIS